MKKTIGIAFLTILISTQVRGQEMLPSDVYYKDNIAVNNISAKAPSLKDTDDDDIIDPGGSGTSSGGGGNWTGAPIGGATFPILSVGMAYIGFLFYRKFKPQHSAK